jgi:hypothetical protein
MKSIALTVFLSISMYGQWITGFYEPGGGPTGEPVSAIPWSKYTHMQLWSAGVASSNDGRVCLGYLTQSDINAFLASKPAGKKALVVIADATSGAQGGDGITCGDGNSWIADTSSGTIGTLVQNIANFVNQAGQNNGGFDGVDLDWEGYLTSSNYTQYVNLINSLRAAMPGKVINIDVFPGGPTATAAAAQSSLDQVNVMCYDEGNFASWSWYNGSIYNAVVNNGTSCKEKMFQVGGDNGAVAAGVAPAKIGVGIPYYGYRWTGCTQAMVTGCTRQNYFSFGILATDSTRWQSQYQNYDTTYKSNYLSIPGLNEFDSYNGVEFMPDVVAWAKSNGFGGYMTFGQHDEYVSNQSGDARFPLSTALYNAVFGSSSGSAPVIATTPLPSGTVGVSYSATLSATGATSISWSVISGSLPAGLSLNSSTGAITGTPSTAGTSSFTVQATNTQNGLSSSAQLSITINVASTAPGITTSSLATGMVGSSYSQTLTATGTAPISWGPATLSLPAGLTWNPSTATISGMPSAAATGTYTFTATNSMGTATKSLPLTINAAANSGPYAYWKFDDGGGSTAADSSGNNHTATLSNAPSWLSSASCVSNGCLSFNGTNQYGSVALDLSGTSAVTLAFWMNWTAYANDDRLAMEFTSNFNNSNIGFMVDPNSSASGGGQFEVGLQGDVGYNQVVFARPAPGWHYYAFVFNKGAAVASQVIPYVDGVAVPYTQVMSSANTNNFGADTFYFMSRGGASLFGNGALDEVRIYSQALSASQIQALAVTVITTTSLPGGTVGTAYSQTLTAAGAVTWSIVSGSLPAGLSLNSSTGAITGTPSTAGTASFTVQAQNSGGSSTKPLSIVISGPTGTPPTITTSSLVSGMVGSSYSQTLTATGTAPISWGPATLSLPAGLTWNPSTATISGMPTAAATGTYTFTATNGMGTATKSMTLLINVAPNSGPYAYWKFDDGGGSAAADSSGNNHTAMLFNAPSWLPSANCVYNGCLSFNGTNQYGSVALDLSGTSAVTLAFWMNWTAYANDDRLAMEFTSNFNNSNIGFMVDPNSSASGGGQFEVGLQGNVGYNQVVFARPAPGWHYYAFVFNKGAAASQVIPYVDGVAVPYTQVMSSANTNNFGADTFYFMSRGGASLFGNGALDEVRIYSQALSPTQVASLYKPITSTQPPAITITSPKPGQIVRSGSQVTFRVNATDNVGVTRVQYMLDGANLGSAVTNAPFSMVWTASWPGSHTLTAEAWDAAGNTAVSAPITFKVR